jgi:hypothetical protein
MKKSEAPVEPVFQVLRAFFDGGFGKGGCWTWFFDGEFVVGCVVNRGQRVGAFLRRKTFTFWKYIFRVCPEVPAPDGRLSMELPSFEFLCFEVGKAITICFSRAE